MAEIEHWSTSVHITLTLTVSRLREQLLCGSPHVQVKKKKVPKKKKHKIVSAENLALDIGGIHDEVTHINTSHTPQYNNGDSSFSLLIAASESVASMVEAERNYFQNLADDKGSLADAGFYFNEATVDTHTHKHKHT